MSTPLIEAVALRGGYGGNDILQGCSAVAAAGEVVVIVGPNGAGKSTLLKAMFGMIDLREGRVRLSGEDVTGLGTTELVRRGIGFVPQERNVFPSLSVHENLEMGGFTARGDLSSRFESVYALFPPLAAKRRQAAGELSGGQRQMVAMGRALMLSPRVLLLDEPTAGLSPLFRAEIFAKVAEIGRNGTAIVLVEQNAREALAIADRGYVLATGRNRFEGTGAALLADPEVAASFLGG
ncbi:MAG: ABC transporter ATP-binding protein [Rhodospirillales bacterium]